MFLRKKAHVALDRELNPLSQKFNSQDLFRMSIRKFPSRELSPCPSSPQFVVRRPRSTPSVVVP